MVNCLLSGTHKIPEYPTSKVNNTICNACFFVEAWHGFLDLPPGSWRTMMGLEHIGILKGEEYHARRKDGQQGEVARHDGGTGRKKGKLCGWA